MYSEEVMSLLKLEAKYIVEGNEAASDITRQRLFNKAKEVRLCIDLLAWTNAGIELVGKQ